MGKPQGDQPNPQAQEPTVDEPEKFAPPSAAEAAALALFEIAAPEPAKVAIPEPEAAKIEAPIVTPLPELVVALAPAVRPAPAPIRVSLEPPKLEAAIAEPVMAQPEDVRPADMRSDETIAAVAAPSLLSAWTMPSIARVRRLAPLAATIAIAAALGAMAGSFATGRTRGVAMNAPTAQTADPRVLKEQIARLHSEIAALKASVDSSARSASAQLSKVGDRLDRVEKAQAEPAAKLAKLTEAIEHRAPATSIAAAAHDITGSVGPVAALAPAPPLDGPSATLPVSPPVMQNWRVRSVYDGAALIQSRFGGSVEVEPGDNLPGLGRIEAIRRQEGKWVVVTSKGMIVAR